MIMTKFENDKVDPHEELEIFSIVEYKFVAPVSADSDKYILNIIYEAEPHQGLPIDVKDEILIDLKDNKLLEYNKLAYSIPMTKLLKQIELHTELDQFVITTNDLTLDITYRDILQMASDQSKVKVELLSEKKHWLNLKIAKIL